MATATVTSKGQITIPALVRNHLRLNPGDRVAFNISRDGRVSMTPKRTSFEKLSGVFRQPGRQALSVRAMDKAIQKTVAMRHRRSTALAQ